MLELLKYISDRWSCLAKGVQCSLSLAHLTSSCYPASPYCMLLPSQTCSLYPITVPLLHINSHGDIFLPPILSVKILRPKSGFLNLSIIDILDQTVGYLAASLDSIHWMLGPPRSHPLPKLWLPKMFLLPTITCPGGQNCSQLRTTGLH